MTRVLIDRLVQTCPACPSQWDGVTDDGRAVYVRFRWGFLSVRVATHGDLSEFAGVRGEELLGIECGRHGLDGTLDEDELVARLEDAGLAAHSSAVAEEHRADVEAVNVRNGWGSR